MPQNALGTSGPEEQGSLNLNYHLGSIIISWRAYVPSAGCLWIGSKVLKSLMPTEVLAEMKLGISPEIACHGQGMALAL